MLDYSLIPDSPGVLDAFAARQVQDNFNQDKLSKFRGTISRVRRKALLSRDPKQIAAFLHLSSMLGVDPSISNTGRQEDRLARAGGKFAMDSQIARTYGAPSPTNWLFE